MREGEVRIVEMFLAGIAAGIMFHRLLMAIVLHQCPDTQCAYCRWLKKSDARYKSAKKRRSDELR